ncbi:MAG: mechanosensitive ion channel family protein [Clostridia bacterium]
MENLEQIISKLNIEIVIQIIIAIGIILVFRALSSVVSSIIIKMLRPKGKEKISVKKNPFYLPLRTIFTFVGIYIALNIIKNATTISPEIQVILDKGIKILLILFVAKAFGDGLDEKNRVFVKIRNKSNKDIDKSTMNAILRITKIAIYVLAGFMVISELGYNISGLITGLGLSSVVITLAAQDTAKSLIGGLAIFLDKPFKVGDYIKVDQYEGTVEEIRFRTTSIRTLENTVLHIANSEMSVAAIINYSEMEKRRYYAKLVLEFDTNLSKIESVKNKIKEILMKMDEIEKETIMINFQEISDNGMDLVVIAYINKTNYAEYLDIKEQINYEIMEILAKENVEMAYNTQTMYLKK